MLGDCGLGIVEGRHHVLVADGLPVPVVEINKAKDLDPGGVRQSVGDLSHQEELLLLHIVGFFSQSHDKISPFLSSACRIVSNWLFLKFTEGGGKSQYIGVKRGAIPQVCRAVVDFTNKNNRVAKVV